MILEITQRQAKILTNLLQCAEDIEAPHATYDADSLAKCQELRQLCNYIEEKLK